MSEQPEPLITINDVALSEAQAATVRVAVGAFHMYLMEPGYLDQLGAVGPKYLERVLEIEALMTKGDHAK